MTTTPSGLTDEMIRNKAIYDSIDSYLLPGETKEGIVKKFKNNLVDTIQFLRTRSYEGMEIVAPKQKPVEKPTVNKVDKAKPAPKKNPKSSDQNTLF